MEIFNINCFEFLLLSVNGLPGVEEQEVFKVFPNPTNGIFTLETAENNYDRLLITVLNTKSQIIIRRIQVKTRPACYHRPVRLWPRHVPDTD